MASSSTPSVLTTYRLWLCVASIRTHESAARDEEVCGVVLFKSLSLPVTAVDQHQEAPYVLCEHGEGNCRSVVRATGVDITGKVASRTRLQRLVAVKRVHIALSHADSSCPRKVQMNQGLAFTCVANKRGTPGDSERKV